MSQTSEPRHANMVRVAAVFLIVLLGVGGYYVYRWSNAADESAVAIEPQAIDNTGGRMALRPRLNGGGGGGGGGAGTAVRNIIGRLVNGDVPPGVKVQRNTLYARSGPGYLRADPKSGGKGYNVEIKYVLSVTQGWGTPEQFRAEEGATLLLEHPIIAKQVELSDVQKKQLEALPSGRLVLTAAQTNQLELLVMAYDKARVAEQNAVDIRGKAVAAEKVAVDAAAKAVAADKSAADAKAKTAAAQRTAADSALKTAGAETVAAAEALMNTVNQIGTAQLAAVKAAMQQRLQKVPTILTAAQVAKANAAVLQAGRPAPAATPGPATRAAAPAGKVAAIPAGNQAKQIAAVAATAKEPTPPALRAKMTAAAATQPAPKAAAAGAKSSPTTAPAN